MNDEGRGKTPDKLSTSVGTATISPNSPLDSKSQSSNLLVVSNGARVTIINNHYHAPVQMK